MLFLPFKIFRLILIAALLSVGLVVLTNYLSPNDDLRKADAIIAISGGDTALRTVHAVQLYQDGWAPKLLFSGDAFDPLSPSNADIMKNIATSNNVPSEDILVEEESVNTKENAENSEDLIDQLGYETIILVTADYHQRRAFIEFSDKLGEEVEIINSSAQEDQWSKKTWWTSPRGWYLTTSETVKIPISILKNQF